jgi:glycosyltransferase involved in cell wall biosynthesis
MISFVIPAYNEERLLPSTLQALHAAARATGVGYELIVANDGSTDRTAAIAAAHHARVVAVANRQIAATRNAGGRAARGEWLIFVDADTIVSEPVLRAAIAALRAGAVGGGAAVRFYGRVPPYARRLLPLMTWVFRTVGIAAGCFLFCTRRGFEAVGGFDETFYAAEEVVMSRALQRHGRFVVVREAVATSARKLRAYSWRDILRLSAALVWSGRRALRTRRQLAYWYEQRREDPEPPGPVAVS